MLSRRSRLPSVQRTAFVAALALAAVVAGMGALQLHQLRALAEDRERAALGSEAVEAAGALAAVLGYHRHVVEELARSPRVHDLLAFGEAGPAARWARELHALLPDVVGLALFTADGRILGDPLAQRVGPACLADLRRRLSGERPPGPRFHDQIPELAHFDLVAEVAGDAEEPLGLVFLSVPVTALEAVLRPFRAEGRSLRVVGPGGRALVAWDGAPPEGAVTVRMAVPGTAWQIVLAQAPAPVALPPGAVAATAGAAGVAVALVLALSLWAARRFHGELRAVERMLRDVLDRRFVATDWHPRLEETSRILPAIAELAARLEKERRRLAQESLTDELTGLPNRRHFNRELVRALEMAERGAVVCVGMVDLDGLKQVNDTHGHETGDRLLRRFAETLDSQLRRTDFAGRIGGDEFGVILYGASAENAVRFMDRVRRVWRERLAGDPELGTLACTLSCGLTFVPVEEACSRVEVLRRADRALYEAKARGRDQVVVDEAIG